MIFFVQAAVGAVVKKGEKGVRHDIEEADVEESYYKWMEDNPNAGRRKNHRYFMQAL